MCGVSRIEPPALWDLISVDERCGAETREWLREMVFDSAEPWRKLLLRFVTGQRSLHFEQWARPILVKPLGPRASPELLPQASTCLRTLYLPAYTSPAVLGAKLTCAIENASGFGLR